MKLVTSDQMREMDRITIEEYGIPGIILMENAGLSVFLAIVDRLGEVAGKRIAVLCGPGNNGGDGYVVARHLANAGAHVDVFHFGDPSALKGDARVNYDAAVRMGLQVVANPSADSLSATLAGCDLAVDALLGTGSHGPPRGAIAEAITKLNASGVTVVAVDIPSGVDADTGSVDGECVRTDLTVTLALPKIGLVTYPAAEYVGELAVAGISMPRVVMDACDSKVTLVESGAVSACFPFRPPGAHKGTYGHVAIAAGSTGMTGACALAAIGALRIGTGLVTMVVPASLNQIMETKVTEAMSIPVEEDDPGAFGLASLDEVSEAVRRRDALVLGPGLGRRLETVSFVLALLEQIECPTVLDADALYAVSTDLCVLSRCKAPLVLTPHPGEMATLIGSSVKEVQSDRLSAAQAFASEHGVTLVLKGAGTITACSDGTAAINPTGCAGMASGGVGDVLSGMIGGLLAQGLSTHDAAVDGVYLHGLAGEIASERVSEPAMIAGDLADSVGEAIMQVMTD